MPREIELTQDDINNYLSQLGAQLGEELVKRNVHETIQVLLIGGVFMVTQLQNRETTHDIDAVILDTDDFMTDWRTQVLMQAARKVASRNKLPRNWFNDDAAPFIYETMRIDQVFYATFGPLEVYMPSLEFMLAAKIMTYREKDKKDVDALLQVLGIKYRAEAQEILDRFVPVTRHQVEHRVHHSLRKLFFY